MTPEQILERIWQLEQEKLIYLEDLEAHRQRLLGPELTEKLDSLAETYAGYQNDLAKNIQELITDLKQAVLERGETIKDEHFSAQLSPARMVYDTKLLEAMASFSPKFGEMAEKCKVERPASVAFRRV